MLFFFKQKFNVITVGFDQNTEIVKSEKHIETEELEVKNEPNENAGGAADNVSIHFVNIQEGYTKLVFVIRQLMKCLVVRINNQVEHILIYYILMCNKKMVVQ